MIVHSAYCETEILSDARKALSLGFPEKALNILKQQKDSSELSKADKEELLLIELEVLVRSSALPLLNRRKYNELSSGKQPQLQYWLALDDIKRKEYAESLEILADLASDKNHPYFESIIRNISKIYTELGNKEEAIHVLAQLDETDPQVVFQKVEIFMDTGRPEEAKELLQRIDMTLDSPHRDIIQARILYLEGDLKGARELLASRQFSPFSPKGREALSFLSLLYSEEENPKCLALIKDVIQHAASSDPLSAYFDQLLLSTQKFPGEREKTLESLESYKTNDREIQPYILFTKAQLNDDLNSKIPLLHRIYAEFSEHPLAEKACFANTLLVSELEDERERLDWLKKIAEFAPNNSLRAKIYGLIAERENYKLGWYAKALKVAGSNQLPSLKVNYNLAQFESNTGGKPFLVSGNESATLLLEKALASKLRDPKNAKIWLEEFFSKQEDHPRVAEAHLNLAELLLQSEDIQTQLGAKGHLETIRSLYLNNLEGKERYYEAQLRIAILEKDLEEINQLVERSELSKSILFQLGYILYEGGYPEQASRAFQGLSNKELSTYENELQEYYIALCHFKISTEEYEADSIKRLDALTRSKQLKIRNGALNILSGYYVGKADLKNALKYLDQLPNSSDKDLLKAKVLSLSLDKKTLDEAGALYEKNYKDSSLALLKRYQITLQYSIFLTDNEKKNEALDLYYQVANFEVLSEPKSRAGWDIYRRIGTKGINLLETSGNWLTAYKFAQLLSRSNSPDKKLFADKAKEISLKHILWDEE